MASPTRRCKESPQPQGRNERTAYTVTTTPWGGGGTSPVVAVQDITESVWMNVTVLVTTGSATIAGDVITTPVIHSLTPGHTYRVEVRWTKISQVLESWFELDAED